MSIWVQELSLDQLNKRAAGSFSDHLKITFTKKEEHSLSATMPIEAWTMQPMGIMHGGASAALAETVASAAANFCIDKEKRCVGLDLNINHIRPVAKGTITATAKPFHMGKKTHVWEILIHDEKQKLVSVSRLTLAVVDKF